MTKSRSRAKNKKPAFDIEVLFQGQVWGTILIIIGVFTLLTLLSSRQGVVAGWWIERLRVLVGGGVLILPFLLSAFGLWAVLQATGRLDHLPWYRLAGALLLFLIVVTGLHMDSRIIDAEGAALAGQGGGLLGWALSDLLLFTIGLPRWLAWFSLVALGLVGLLMLAGSLIIAGGGLALIWISQLRDDWEIGRAGSRGIVDLPSGEPSWWRRLAGRLLPQAGQEAGRLDEIARLPIGGNGAPPTTGQPAAPSRPTPRIIGGDAPQATPAQTLAGQSRGPAPGSAESLIPRIIGGGHAWRLPNIPDILDDATEVEISKEEIRERARIIEKTLSDFGVPVRVVEANQGPAVTQYGLQPGYRRRRKSADEIRREAEEILKQRYGGRRTITDEMIQEVMKNEVDRYERVKIKVSKIQSLTNDLALALAASPIRIEAPVPGRPVVGIEVPNMQKALVSLRGVMESDAFRGINAPLKIALGQDTAGQAAVADLTRMPHLLIAGATGSGKSVCVNAIISALLLTHTPDTLRFLMVDPKMVELTTYNGIPHLLSPVVVELEKVVPLLRWATGEMDRRYKLFSKAGARNLEAYNEKQLKKGEQPLPYMIVVIDELADLMMAAPDDVERYICRLAQMSRATGIHLIIATQRPSVDVVTGLIKANFPARIAFAVTSQIDSRVILDTPGAEALLGRGDMLFMRPDSSKLERLQGCFVSDVELEKLVRYWRGIRVVEGEAEEDLPLPAASLGPEVEPVRPEDVIQPPLWEEMIARQRQADSEDDLYEDALEVVRQAGRGSVSLLQRRLRIGYSRAARLIDLLEERGVLGPDLGGSRGREVLMAETEEDKATPRLGSMPRASDHSADKPPRVWY